MAAAWYGLRHGFSDSRYSLRHWRLEASHTGRSDGEWVVLREHGEDDGDESLNGGFASASWPTIPPQQPEFFRFFRVITTGKNSDGSDRLASGFEVWGLVRRVGAAAQKTRRRTTTTASKLPRKPSISGIEEIDGEATAAVRLFFCCSSRARRARCGQQQRQQQQQARRHESKTDDIHLTSMPALRSVRRAGRRRRGRRLAGGWLDSTVKKASASSSASRLPRRTLTNRPTWPTSTTRSKPTSRPPCKRRGPRRSRSEKDHGGRGRGEAGGGIDGPERRRRRRRLHRRGRRRHGKGGLRQAVPGGL